jgi:ribosome biogenesis protein MAK21
MTPGAPRSYQPVGLRNIPVNSANYLKTDEDKIPAEEKFFYRYFKERSASKPDIVDDASDTESVGDDEFDQLMSNYFKTTKGKGLEDEDDDLDESLDFAADIHVKPVGKKRKKSMEEEESEDEEMSEPEGSDDEFGAADDADEMLDLSDDDDDFEEEDGLEVFENDDFEEPMKKNKRKLGKGVDMFAPAEEFAEMLETNADEGMLSGPNTLINRDNADPKQLKWEMDRDRWVKGYKRNSKTKFSNKKTQKRRKK